MVDQDAVAADGTVVGDVGADHQHVVVAHGCAGVVAPAAVNGYIFANSVVAADRERAAGIVHVHVLGRAADDSPFADFIIAAERRSRLDDRTGGESAAIADDGASFDDAPGADDDVAPELRPW